ncbi:uncharacterized protein G6M90_00g112840 [Metarhizium brunneum]|uniref:Uncharacterized protein n=1 Tax=Metarhizium brunneum TaxID=500148 RepID=A0A7D5Z5H3_9HYPO
MPQSGSSQKSTSPQTRPATPISDKYVGGLWIEGKRQLNREHDSSGKDTSTPLDGHGQVFAPDGPQKTPVDLASYIHNLHIGNEQVQNPHTNASTDRGDSIPGQSSGPYSNTSTCPVGIWDISKDVPASSVLESWIEEDLLNWGVGEGIDINDRLPPITNYVSVEEVEGTAATKKLQSDTGHVSSATVEVPGSLPPPLSAVGAPTVAESHTLPLAETEDTVATGNTDIDSPCSHKVPSASERPESSFALRDVSVIPWTDCYPDDPDKARELATSTGVPGLQIYSVYVFTHATSDTQVLDEVDATQDGHNFRVEMEPQPNDSVRASSVTDSERADESGWVKVEIETENPDQTDNV